MKMRRRDQPSRMQTQVPERAWNPLILMSIPRWITQMIYHQPPRIIQIRTTMPKPHRRPQLSRAMVLENSALPLNHHQSRRLQLRSQRYLKNSTLLPKDESLCKLRPLIGIENLPLAPLRNRRQCAPGENGNANGSVNEKESEKENENENESSGNPLRDRKWRPEHGKS